MLTSLLALTVISNLQTPIKVEIVPRGEGWQLLRGGKPYVINGVGGTGRMDDLVKYGGNSMRGWGAERAGEELDAMQAKGLTYTVGIWLGHRSYFNYDDPAQVARQKEEARQVILRHRNHPALLMWGLGNEMEVDNNDRPILWQAVNDLAKMAKELDPHHPTMTVVAEVTQEKIDRIKKYAPEIDVLGVNSYGGLSSLPKRLKEFGWTKPWVVTEFGPLGPWERPKTAWNAALEPTSTEKAELYQRNFQQSIANQPACLGSYAFLWGDKQEETPTWFGMFLPTGEKTAAVDVMSHGWTGKWPAHRAPRIREFLVDASGRTVKPGAPIAAQIQMDPGTLTYEWIVKLEVVDKRFAGEGEKRPGVVDAGLGGVKQPRVRFNAPRVPGNYRVYVYVRDGKGGGATANAPFQVAE